MKSEGLSRIALVGQLNSGKSTLFNNLAGFHTLSGNFPGTTVTYIVSTTRFDGERLEIVDLPGIYSLSGGDIAEKIAREYLLKEDLDAVINVIDASALPRALELTLQLLELEIPLVVCLNMVDEARRKGIEINVEKLSEILGVPVVPTIAVRGIGLRELLRVAIRNKSRGNIIHFTKDIEEAIERVKSLLPEDLVKELGVPPRFLSLRLLEGDGEYIDFIRKKERKILEAVKAIAEELEACHNVPANILISSARHALSLDIFEKVARIVHPPRLLLDERLDRYLMHPVGGYLLLLIILGFTFYLVFKIGSLIGAFLFLPFDALSKSMESLAHTNLFYALLSGLIGGIAGGMGIVLPYLVPLLLFISLLEDAGYLPRVAFLLDGLFHKIGLHGKSAIPFVMGYGCNVPALVATRVLESPSDRIVAGLLISYIPCSARSVVIMALVGAYLGPLAAFLLYFFNLFIISLLGKFLRGFFPAPIEGFVMDIPTYKWPPLRYALKKVYFRLYEFLVFAWPVIIVASMVWSILGFYSLTNPINSILSPLTVHILGLPPSLGMSLFFGILRKELTLMLLSTALGTTHISNVLSPLQILTFTTFAIFYIPCISFLAIMRKELGYRYTILSALLSLGIATLLGALVRLAGLLL